MNEISNHGKQSTYMSPYMTNNQMDSVIIHVCDENRQIKRDFTCSRSLLVKNMKYFEHFLINDNNNHNTSNNSYDDIDISVHCDVEIFEWLMAYINTNNGNNSNTPILEKSIVVSILISSEFLQMDLLVDQCLECIANNLNDIIRMPIDLSCISEKLINKLAVLTSPRILALSRDRKDKILLQLYKRRVELDFSRKSVYVSSSSNSIKTIASALTCCRYCGIIYIDTYTQLLTCRNSPLSIDFRGRLARRHYGISGWSLTNYIKTLHTNNLKWDAIYWHVWSTCVVIKANDIAISLNECDRYLVDGEGILIRRSIPSEVLAPYGIALIDSEDHLSPSSDQASNKWIENDSCRVTIQTSYNSKDNIPSITPSLNPMRPPDILTSEIHELLTVQFKAISNSNNRKIIESTNKLMIRTALATNRSEEQPALIDFTEAIWNEREQIITHGFVSPSNDDQDSNTRGRSRSPLRPTTSTYSKTSARKNSSSDSGVVSTIERRSRSSSAGTSRNRTTKSSSLPPPPGITTSKSQRISLPKPIDSTISNDIANDSSSLLPTDLALRALPPEVQRKWAAAKGVCNGLWIHKYTPLESYPQAYYDSINAVSEPAGLTENKRLEWVLDLLREYDEKRMDKFESFLLSKRIDPLGSTISRSMKQCYINRKKNGLLNNQNSFDVYNSNEYYRDKGRQPIGRGL